MTKLLRRSPLVVVALATLSAFLFTVCAQMPLFEEERIFNIAHIPDSGIRVETVNGSISVKSDDRAEVQIKARIKAVSEERLQAVRIAADRTADQTLAVQPVWPNDKRQNREGCSLEILIPEANGVYLRSSNGKLLIHGLKGKAELRTSNGKVEAGDHAGMLIAQTSNGSISASRIHGAVDVQTSNGKVSLVDCASSTKAKSSNGTIHIMQAPEAQGPIQARTSNGAITLELGGSFSGELELETTSGSLNVEDMPGAELESMSKKQARIVIGDSGQKSSATTSNGSIKVSRRK